MINCEARNAERKNRTKNSILECKKKEQNAYIQKTMKKFMKKFYAKGNN
jgi:hypothetical protein